MIESLRTQLAPFIHRIFPLEERAHPSQPDEWLMSLGTMDSATGRDVTPLGSLENTAVFACVRVLAESVASLPLHVFRRLERGKERATDHPLYTLLHDLPNPEMGALQFREVLMGHLALWGNAFAEIEYNRAGRVMALWPLRPDMVIVKRINRRLVYDVLMPSGPNVRLSADRVMHVPAFGYDGVIGFSPISLARQAIGLGLATEEFGARFFGNGARPGMVFEHPGLLGEKAQARLAKSINERHQGLENAHRIMILEEGMGIKEVGIPPEDAQFLETRKFQVNEIARLYRVPPHMIGDLERATFTNIEHQGAEFVRYTLTPWLKRWEEAIYKDLLLPRERAEYFAQHLADSLLRGDIQSRYEAYSVGRQNGWLSANDIREIENMNPIEGGDEYLIPLNMTSASALDDAPTPASTAAGGDENRANNNYYEKRAAKVASGRARIIASQRRIIEATTRRIIRREVNDVRRQSRKLLGQRNTQEFGVWLTQFYREHRQFWMDNLQPILLSFAEQIGLDVSRELDIDELDSINNFVTEFVEALAARQTGESLGQLQALLDEALQEGTNPAEAIEARLDAWDDSRVGRVAQAESSQAGNAFAKTFYMIAGVVRLMWVTRGSENCPYCKAMDGKVIGIQELFLEKERDFKPSGADVPLNSRRNIGHPPLHKGCDCQVIAR